jgi:hypothetical protein
LIIKNPIKGLIVVHPVKPKTVVSPILTSIVPGIDSMDRDDLSRFEGEGGALQKSAGSIG